MKKLLNLPWALTLNAITSHHLAQASPAAPVGAGGTSTIVQPGSGSASGNVAYALPNGPALNATNAFSGIGAVSSGFPPGPCPPEDVTFYRVPNSFPPITIKFQDLDTSQHPPPWRPQRGRNETSTRILLAELVEEYSVGGDNMTEYSYEWEEGPAPNVYIYMQPQEPDEYEPQDLVLSEHSWADTVRGFQDFLTAYPGLAFRFEAYLLYEPDQEFYAAGGHLSIDAQEDKVSVT